MDEYLSDEVLEYLKKCMPVLLTKCKNCKHCVKYEYKEGLWCRKLGLTSITENDYCSWAEKNEMI